MHMFEKALRNKYRYASTRGELTTEQLMDLPLTSKSGFDLDSVAKAINRELRSNEGESFVSNTPSAVQQELSQKLEIIKYIIDVRLKENAEKSLASKKAQEKQKLLEILEHKDNESLQNLSREDLLKRIQEL